MLCQSTYRHLTSGMMGICALVMLIMAEPSLAADMDKPPAVPAAEEIFPQPKPGDRLSTGLSAPLASTPLEDILLQKGLITQDEWLRIKAEEEKKSYERVTESQYRSSPRWFERINVNGYFQFRYGMKSDSKLQLSQGDGTLTNNNQDFYFRRIRMVFQGQMSDRVAFFFQAAHEGNGFRLQELELVDAYGDYFLTKDKEHRLRFGLHRVPNSFDTYRSSSQRQELDRSEAIQSGAPGERDLGLAYYWSPKVAQERYAQLATYHNGPGDYGVFGIMVYNGQGRSQTEANHNKHIGAKVSYPFELPNGRLLEAGVMGFLGEYVVQTSGTTTVGTSATSDSRCPNNLKNGGCSVDEDRVTGYIWTPPQPWGIMAEYTIGTGPERNSAGIIERQSLHGGYVQGNYTWRYSDVGMLTPYVRYSYYKGGFKNQGAAAANNIMYNVGLVWEPDTHLRLVTEYLWTDQLNISNIQPGLPQEYVAGQMLRFQMQWFFN